ncbi:hypothetical protein [Neolewinella litorea]|uniref:Uncharacterized protein n=1 Tax=Neolewinella litorea TaxID=2562452 RepID=A0A4S4NQT3_9BACT|nr:hypothetical protein [Neolewinella litorea]THH40698.1 hypothetical protein E4021_08185 [Neolewinella litorea]
MPRLDSSIRGLNEEPRDDFEGLSSSQMRQLLYFFLGPGSLVKVRDDLDAATLAELPLPRFATDLLNDLAKGEIKLTAKGNLPGKLVKDYYATGRLPDYAIERGITKLTGEDDYLPMQTVKHLLLQLRWIKKRQNRLSITAKGKKALRLPPADFFREMFVAHFTGFNLGWWDMYPDTSMLQHFAPYLTFLLLVLGETKRPITDYSSRLRRAFPMLNEDYPGTLLDRATETRLFERYLAYYGFVEVTRERYNPPQPATVVVTDRFRRVFHLDRDARPAPPSEEEQYERQLKTALFDAEMGSQTMISDDLPLEMLEAFQQQIRELEQQHSGAPTVRIGDLIGDIKLVPPREITGLSMARREISRLTEALRAQRILVQEAEAAELDDINFYEYLYNMLLNHEIVPPPPGTKRMVPFHEVFLANFDPLEALTESFLLALFDLDHTFPADLLAREMRLDNRVVPRQRALEHLRKWRKEYTSITPLAFEVVTDGPHVEPPSDRQAIKFYLVAYEVVRRAGGAPETFEGPGVMEFLLEDDEWRITGAEFPGFAF